MEQSFEAPDGGVVEAPGGGSEPAATALQEAARRGLGGTRFAGARWVVETGSTNADLLAEARRRPELDAAALLAESQAAGRGRRGRSWVAPPGSGLLVSVLARPPLSPGRAHLTSTAMAVAAAEAVEEVCGLVPGLKWPNDLVVERSSAEGLGTTRKLAGILAESVVVGDRLEAVVVGMGCNVTVPDEVPAELAATATWLDAEVDAAVDRAALAVALLRRLDGRLAALADDAGRARLAADYRTRCVTIGRAVRVELADGALVGTVTGIDDDGRLELVEDAGDRHVIAVGDVVHLRPRP